MKVTGTSVEVEVTHGTRTFRVSVRRLERTDNGAKLAVIRVGPTPFGADQAIVMPEAALWDLQQVLRAYDSAVRALPEGDPPFK